MSSHQPPAYEPAPPAYNSEEGISFAPPPYSEIYPDQDVDKLSVSASVCRHSRRLHRTVKDRISVLCTPFAAVVMFLVLGVIPVSMVVMGSVYIHRCTIRPFIPLFVLIFGVICLAVTIVHLIKMVILHKTSIGNHDQSVESNTKRNSCEVVSMVFLVIWFIIGTFYTFRTWKQWSENGSVSCSDSGHHLEDCCDAAIMYFAIVALLLMFVLTASSIAIGCCCFCLIGVLSRL